MMNPPHPLFDKQEMEAEIDDVLQAWIADGSRASYSGCMND